MEKTVGTIKHFATVVKAGRQHVKVMLDEVSAEECGGCHLAGMCGKAGKTEITIRRAQDSPQLTVGDHVLLTAEADVQYKAVVWSLGLPVAIFLIAILGLSNVDWEGWAVALVSLGAVALYFLLLWIFYPRIFKREIWKISLINN